MSYNSIWGYLTGEGGNIDPYTGGYSITGSSANTEVLYNDNGNIAGDSDHTWDKTGGVLKVGPSHTTAAGTNGLAVGDSCTVSANKAVAIGDSTTASASNTFASGNGTTASAGNAVSIGLDTIASGTQSLAAGNSSTASGSNSAAFGNGSLASGAQSIAGGISATASGTTSLAFGNSATAGTSNSIALGQGSTADANDAVAIGRDAYADNQQAVAIGYNSFSSADRAIVIGNARAVSNSDNTVVIAASSSTADQFTTSTSSEKVFLWARNGTSYNNGIGLYVGENTTKKGTLTVEHGSKLAWDYTPITSSSWTGRSYDTTNPASVGSALDLIAAEVNTLEGTNNDPSGADAVCFGNGNTASGVNSFAGGESCVASADNCISMGTSSTASGSQAMALGTSSTAGGANSIAMAGGTTVATGSLAIGSGSSVSSQYATVIGNGTISGTAATSGMLLSACTNVSNKVALGDSAKERIYLHAANNGSYDNSVVIYAGFNATKKETSIKEHGSSLTWSYTPTTSGDWTGLPSAPSAPVNIGTALDLLAANIGTALDYEATTVNPVSFGFGPTASQWNTYGRVDNQTLHLTRIGNLVNITIPAFTIPCTATIPNPGYQITCSAAIPAAWRPSNGMNQIVWMTSLYDTSVRGQDSVGSTSYFDNYCGNLFVNPSGVITFSHKNGTSYVANDGESYSLTRDMTITFTVY